VVRRFEPPPSRYAAGHRGIDLRSTAGDRVTAVQAGRVTHVGSIAGRGTVSVLHPSGIRSTYEPVRPTVRPGQPLARGDPVGVVSAGGHCGTGCLHLGARRGPEYLDPLPLLVGGPVVLLPLE
jgi:murein DD-endopeptidase MepM/ murein hydrolase activator NlpD